MLANRFFGSVYSWMTEREMIPIYHSVLKWFRNNDFVFVAYQSVDFVSPMVVDTFILATGGDGCRKFQVFRLFFLNFFVCEREMTWLDFVFCITKEM